MGRRKLPDILTQSEQEQLLAAFDMRYKTPRRNRAMIELGLFTGMRVAEIASLKWGDINFNNGKLHLKNGKGGKDRILWVRPQVLHTLNRINFDNKQPTRGLVFTTGSGRPLDHGYLRRTIAKYARKAGIEKKVHFHLLRHTYLSNLYSQTKNIRLVQEVAGHSAISTTQIYTHVSGQDIRAAMLGE